ncbi:MAG: hypothetical protein IPH30_13935 [Betaproteobacteria bacterium]|nr:hypothetical protein [Betaproteobacteria bacterium]
MKLESENRDQSGREPPPQPQPEGQAPVIRSAGITLAGSALGGALVILAEFLAARLLQVQAYGFYASGKAVASIGEAVSVFGMPVAIFHFIPAYRQKAQTEHVIGTVYAAALLPLVVGPRSRSRPGSSRHGSRSTCFTMRRSWTSSACSPSRFRSWPVRRSWGRSRGDSGTPSIT